MFYQVTNGSGSHRLSLQVPFLHYSSPTYPEQDTSNLTRADQHDLYVTETDQNCIKSIVYSKNTEPSLFLIYILDSAVIVLPPRYFKTERAED